MALKFCFKTCVAMKFVDDDDDDKMLVNAPKSIFSSKSKTNFSKGYNL